MASPAPTRPTVHPQRLAVRDAASIAEAVSRIVAAHGRIDILVNNAGLGFARDVGPWQAGA
jgi:NADP-dependent 3-hydroxy acid dehydrogenase YdfG